MTIFGQENILNDYKQIYSWLQFLQKIVAIHCCFMKTKLSLSVTVAAVGDGLKAWEILNGRSHNIDLILTEVDLPSISGYALLSLIMEHEVCKNIPVISTIGSKPSYIPSSCSKCLICFLHFFLFGICSDVFTRLS